ncbi:MAG: hypothetical protein ABIM40_13970, partial [Pseudomonadota bacterium]
NKQKCNNFVFNITKMYLVGHSKTKMDETIPWRFRPVTRLAPPRHASCFSSASLCFNQKPGRVHAPAGKPRGGFP